MPEGRWVKSTRWSLLKAPEHQTVRQLAKLHEVSQVNHRLYRAFLLREELRLLYHLPDPALAPAHLDAWLAWASRSRLRPFVRLARTLRAHRDGILAAIRLGLSNACPSHCTSWWGCGGDAVGDGGGAMIAGGAVVGVAASSAVW